jgi:hypothetical protein
MNFNHECWLMLLGYPLDYSNTDSMQSFISSFDRMLLWENSRSHLARLLLRARVTDLQNVPHFLVITDVEGFYHQMKCKFQFRGKMPTLLSLIFFWFRTTCPGPFYPA